MLGLQEAAARTTEILALSCRVLEVGPRSAPFSTGGNPELPGIPHPHDGSARRRAVGTKQAVPSTEDSLLPGPPNCPVLPSDLTIQRPGWPTVHSVASLRSIGLV